MFVLKQGLFHAGYVSRLSFARMRFSWSQACSGSLLMADHREQRSDAAIQESWGAVRSAGLLRFARNDKSDSAQMHFTPEGSAAARESAPKVLK
jgi:hypothetical protein